MFWNLPDFLLLFETAETSPWSLPCKETNFASRSEWRFGKGMSAEDFSFWSPAVHWMAGTSSANCLSCKNTLPTLSFTECLSLIQWKGASLHWFLLRRIPFPKLHSKPLREQLSVHAGADHYQDILHLAKAFTDLEFWSSCKLGLSLLLCLHSGKSLVAPYCAIPRDYLSDTPLLRAMGFLVSKHSGKDRAHKHKSIWPVTVRWGGKSPGQVSRGQRFVCHLRNPRNINLLSGYPTGKTGHRGDRTEFYVPKFYVPFLLPKNGHLGAIPPPTFLSVSPLELWKCVPPRTPKTPKNSK